MSICFVCQTEYPNQHLLRGYNKSFEEGEKENNQQQNIHLLCSLFFSELHLVCNKNKLTIYNLKSTANQDANCTYCNKISNESKILKCFNQTCSYSIHITCFYKSQNMSIATMQNDNQQKKCALFCSKHSQINHDFNYFYPLNQPIQYSTLDQIQSSNEQFIKYFLITAVKQNDDQAEAQEIVVKKNRGRPLKVNKSSTLTKNQQLQLVQEYLGEWLDATRNKKKEKKYELKQQEKIMQIDLQQDVEEKNFLQQKPENVLDPIINNNAALVLSGKIEEQEVPSQLEPEIQEQYLECGYPNFNDEFTRYDKMQNWWQLIDSEYFSVIPLNQQAFKLIQIPQYTKSIEECLNFDIQETNSTFVEQEKKLWRQFSFNSQRKKNSFINIHQQEFYKNNMSLPFKQSKYLTVIFDSFKQKSCNNNNSLTQQNIENDYLILAQFKINKKYAVSNVKNNKSLLQLQQQQSRGFVNSIEFVNSKNFKRLIEIKTNIKAEQDNVFYIHHSLSKSQNINIQSNQEIEQSNNNQTEEKSLSNISNDKELYQQISKQIQSQQQSQQTALKIQSYNHEYQLKNFQENNYNQLSNNSEINSNFNHFYLYNNNNQQQQQQQLFESSNNNKLLQNTNKFKDFQNNLSNSQLIIKKFVYLDQKVYHNALNEQTKIQSIQQVIKRRIKDNKPIKQGGIFQQDLYDMDQISEYIICLKHNLEYLKEDQKKRKELISIIENNNKDLNYSNKLKIESELLLNEIEFCEIKRYFRLGFQDKSFDPYNYFKKLKYPKKKINKTIKNLEKIKHQSSKNTLENEQISSGGESNENLEEDQQNQQKRQLENDQVPEENLQSKYPLQENVQRRNRVQPRNNYNKNKKNNNNKQQQQFKKHDTIYENTNSEFQLKQQQLRQSELNNMNDMEFEKQQQYDQQDKEEEEDQIEADSYEQKNIDKDCNNQNFNSNNSEQLKSIENEDINKPEDYSYNQNYNQQLFFTSSNNQTSQPEQPNSFKFQVAKNHSKNNFNNNKNNFNNNNNKNDYNNNDRSRLKGSSKKYSNKHKLYQQENESIPNIQSRDNEKISQNESNNIQQIQQNDIDTSSSINQNRNYNCETHENQSSNIINLNDQQNGYQPQIQLLQQVQPVQQKQEIIFDHQNLQSRTHPQQNQQSSNNYINNHITQNGVQFLDQFRNQNKILEFNESQNQQQKNQSQNQLQQTNYYNTIIKEEIKQSSSTSNKNNLNIQNNSNSQQELNIKFLNQQQQKQQQQQEKPCIENQCKIDNLQKQEEILIQNEQQLRESTQENKAENNCQNIESEQNQNNNNNDSNKMEIEQVGNNNLDDIDSNKVALPQVQNSFQSQNSQILKDFLLIPYFIPLDIKIPQNLKDIQINNFLQENQSANEKFVNNEIYDQLQAFILSQNQQNNNYSINANPAFTNINPSITNNNSSINNNMSIEIIQTNKQQVEQSEQINQLPQENLINLQNSENNVNTINNKPLFEQIINQQEEDDDLLDLDQEIMQENRKIKFEKFNSYGQQKYEKKKKFQQQKQKEKQIKDSNNSNCQINQNSLSHQSKKKQIQKQQQINEQQQNIINSINLELSDGQTVCIQLKKQNEENQEQHRIKKKKFKKLIDIDCSICYNNIYTDNNPVVYCSECQSGMHQKCYGIEEIPKGKYFCDQCYFNQQLKQIKRKRDLEDQELNCFLCDAQEIPIKIFKLENQDVLFAHPTCLYVNNMAVLNKGKIKLLSTEFQQTPEIKCKICEKNTGIKFKCEQISCDQHYHITCAYLNGFQIKVDNSEFFDETTMTSSSFTCQVFCALHQNKDRNKELQIYLRKFAINYQSFCQYQDFDYYKKYHKETDIILSQPDAIENNNSNNKKKQFIQNDLNNNNQNIINNQNNQNDTSNHSTQNNHINNNDHILVVLEEEQQKQLQQQEQQNHPKQQIHNYNDQQISILL